MYDSTTFLNAISRITAQKEDAHNRGNQYHWWLLAAAEAHAMYRNWGMFHTVVMNDVYKGANMARFIEDERMRMYNLREKCIKHVIDQCPYGNRDANSIMRSLDRVVDTMIARYVL